MILIAFGSNLSGPWGTPEETVRRAAEELQRNGVRLVALSSLLFTRPMGPKNQPDFVNAVARVESFKSPEALMRLLLTIERRAGRKRRRRWGARTLDLDLIDYHGRILRSPRGEQRLLILPHPGISSRSFVLEPINEIAPRWRDPLTHETAGFTLRKRRGLNIG